MIYILLIIVLVVIVFSFFKTTKPKEVRIETIPLHWHSLLTKNVLFYKNLTIEDQLYFRKQVLSFLNTVHIEAVEFKLEELDRLLVASSAVIPVFNFDNWSYPNINTVLVYPDYFNEKLQFATEHKDRNIGGLVGTGRFENQMILSKKALYHGFSNKTDKGNTGIHEFVHLLDKLDGVVDGIPKALISNENISLWLDLIHKKMEAINNDESDIRHYGGTSRIEFFAVASEYFFERPMLLKRKHPELHKMLSECFNFDSLPS